MRTLLAILAAPIALITLAAPAGSAPAASGARRLVEAVRLPARSFTLPNGLRVVVREDRRLPIVVVNLWYGVASRDERPGQHGFAHLVEHLGFLGTAAAPGSFYDRARALGARGVNASTDFDRTNFYWTVPRPALDAALALEADRMANLGDALTPAKLAAQREVVKSEKRQQEAVPEGEVRPNAFPRLFGPAHPYGHLPAGSVADLDRATVADARAWLRDWYGPNNAVLVLAGDVDPATARRMVERRFGSIPRGRPVGRAEAPVRRLARPEHVVLRDRVGAETATFYWPAPGLRDPQAPALLLTAALLGARGVGPLERALVTDAGVATDVVAWFRPSERAGNFGVRVVLKPGMTADRAAELVGHAVRRFTEAKIDPDALEAARMEVVAQRVRDLRTLWGQSEALAQGALFDGDAGAWRRRLQALAGSDAAAVARAARDWLLHPSLRIEVLAGARPVEPTADTARPAPIVSTASLAATFSAAQAAPPAETLGDLVEQPVSRARLRGGTPVSLVRHDAAPFTSARLLFAAPGGDRRLLALTAAIVESGGMGGDPARFQSALRRLGATVAVRASPDAVLVDLTAPTASLSEALALVRDAVTPARVSGPATAPAKRRTLARIAAEEAGAASLARRIAPELLFGADHPESRRGEAAAIERATDVELFAFMRRWLRPDAAELLLVSDRPLGALSAALDAALDGWAVRPAPPRENAMASPMLQAPTVRVEDRPGAPEAVILGTAAVSRTDADHAALAAAVAALSGTISSRINAELRERLGWTYGVTGELAARRDAFVYTLVAPVAAGRTCDALRKLRTLHGDFVGPEPITAAELATVAREARLGLPASLEAPEALLDLLMENAVLGRQDGYAARHARAVASLSPGEVSRAAGRLFDPKRMSWLVIGPAAELAGSCG